MSQRENIQREEYVQDEYVRGGIFSERKMSYIRLQYAFLF